MSHVRTTFGVCGRAQLALAACCALALATSMLLASARVAAAAPPDALQVGNANPAAFVPDWNGEDDSTAVPVRVDARSLVTVRVRAADGRVVRLLARRVDVPTGTTTFYWDGRDASGRTAATGRYAIDVLVRPVIGVAGAMGIASTQPAVGATPPVRGSVSVRVVAPAIGIHDIQVSRGFLAERAAASRTNVSFQLTRRGRVSVAVADVDGNVVRNLLRGDRASGTGRVMWNGRSDAGRRVRDGSYTLLLSATGGGAPTSTMSVPLRVDTKAPGFTLGARRLGARVHKGAVSVSLPVRAGEAGRLTVRRGGRVAIRRVPIAAGARHFNVPGAQLGIRPRGRRTTYRLHVTLVDAAGNSRTVRASVNVRAARRTRHSLSGPAPVPTPVPAPVPVAAPNPAPPAVAGALAWPTTGVLTSPFGPRDGRMHQGMDIAAPTGTPIYAAGGGVVSYAGTMSGYGNIVVLEHPGGITTYYAHQSKVLVVVGQQLARGDQLGLIGSTGRSTGPHLHFEVRFAGIPADPMRYLPAR